MSANRDELNARVWRREPLEVQQELFNPLPYWDSTANVLIIPEVSRAASVTQA